jgi:hypothetical protein
LLRRLRSEEFLGRGSRLPDRSPDGALDGRHGVAGKSAAPTSIVVEKSLPESQPPCLQRFGEGQLARPLLAYYPLHQTFVLGQSLDESGDVPRG